MAARQLTPIAGTHMGVPLRNTMFKIGDHGPMRDEFGRPYRRSIRLHNYDYSENGAYFVTVCTEGRQRLFGQIREDAIDLNDAGQMIDHWWLKLQDKFPSIQTDERIIMPNHFHAIMWVVGAAPRGRPPTDANCGHPHGGAPTTLFDVMEWFKTMTTNAYIRGVKQKAWPPFPRRLWQRGYYEHVIRDERDLFVIRQYIRYNARTETADKPFCYPW